MANSERWNSVLGKRQDNPLIDRFLEEVDEVSRKHGLSIAHEDYGGSFLIHARNENDCDWLFGANDAIGEDPH